MSSRGVENKGIK